MNIRNSLIYQYWKGVLEKYPEKFVTTVRDIKTINKENKSSEYTKAVEQLLLLVIKNEKEHYNSAISDCLFVLRSCTNREKLNDLAKLIKVWTEYEERLAFLEKVLQEHEND